MERRLNVFLRGRCGFRGAWFSACAMMLLLPTCMISAASTIVINTETEYDSESGDVAWRISNSGDALADKVSISAVLQIGRAHV